VVIALPQIDVLLHHPWIFRLHHMGIVPLGHLLSFEKESRQRKI